MKIAQNVVILKRLMLEMLKLWKLKEGFVLKDVVGKYSLLTGLLKNNKIKLVCWKLLSVIFSTQ